MNFKKYPTSRKGIFSVHDADGPYTLPTGWPKKTKEYAIIGEDADSFVYEIKALTYGEWRGNKVVPKKCTIPMGLHKSSLVCWSSGQLTLF